MYNKLKEFHDAFKNLKMPDNYEAGAQVNVIESISLNGVKQPVTNKNVALDLSDYAKKSELNILSTTPATVDGGIWFAFENYVPVLKLYYEGEEYTFQSTTKHEGATTYYISRDNANLIEDYKVGDIVVLEAGLELTDGTFIPRNEYSDLALTFGTDATATIRTTTPAALEYLETQGRVILFVDQAEKRHKVTFYSDGRIVEGKAITLASSFADTAFGAGDYTSVTSARSPISIQGGTVASSLTGGAGNDTLVGNSGSDTLTGGAGADLFAVKLTGNNFITDFDAASDKVSLVAGDMNGINAITAASGGLTLEFDGGSLMLGGSTGGTVTVNGTGWVIGDNMIMNTDRTAVTFFKAVTADLSTNPYTNVSTANARGGGSIKANSTGVALSGNGASLIGGAGNDTFCYIGSDITVGSYAESDRVSLRQGDTLGTVAVDEENNQVQLTIQSAQGDGVITFDGLEAGTQVTFCQGDNVFFEELRVVPNVFNNSNHRSATAVTVNSAFADFSTLTDSTNDPGNEYYTSLKAILCTKPNSTIKVTKNANEITFIGGEANNATGGLNADNFIFNSCGGTVNDFGINALRDTVKTYAKSTTQEDTEIYYAYSRDLSDGAYYAQGKDSLQVDGTVTAVKFDGHGDTTTSANRFFGVDVTYTGANGDNYVIHLPNINKPTDRKVYVTDDEAAEDLNIIDKRTGELVLIGTETLKTLFTG